MNKYEKARAQVYNSKATNESLKAITELVERATPKKVVKLGKTQRHCPNCHIMIKRYDWNKHIKIKYCYECGQRIDWSNE